MQRTAQAVTVAPLDSAERRQAASRLYRDVFGYADPAHAISPRLLRALLDHGGTALGAYDGSGATLGFCYGFPAADATGAYHYSQAVAVDERARGLGVGRALKLAQADAARRAGARAMRWAFDPLLTRNAHFNLAVLGARVSTFHRSYYDEPGTDRAIAEWALEPAALEADRRNASADVAAVCEATGGAAPHDALARGAEGHDGTGLRTGEAVGPTGRALRWMAVPLDPSSPAGAVATRVADEVSDRLGAVLDAGYTLVACVPARQAESRHPSEPFALYVLGRSPAGEESDV